MSALADLMNRIIRSGIRGDILLRADGTRAHVTPPSRPETDSHQVARERYFDGLPPRDDLECQIAEEIDAEYQKLLDAEEALWGPTSRKIEEANPTARKMLAHEPGTPMDTATLFGHAQDGDTCDQCGTLWVAGVTRFEPAHQPWDLYVRVLVCTNGHRRHHTTDGG